MHRSALEQPQHGSRLLHAHKGLLVAVAVQPYLHGLSLKHVGSDAAGGHFTHDKLVVEQGASAQSLGLLAQPRGHQVGIFVAEGEDARRLDAHQHVVALYHGREQFHIFGGQLLGTVQAALGDGGAAALHMARHHHLVAQMGEQTGKSLSELRLLMVGELVGQQVYPAAVAAALISRARNTGHFLP